MTKYYETPDMQLDLNIGQFMSLYEHLLSTMSSLTPARQRQLRQITDRMRSMIKSTIVLAAMHEDEEALHQLDPEIEMWLEKEQLKIADLNEQNESVKAKCKEWAEKIIATPCRDQNGNKVLSLTDYSDDDNTFNQVYPRKHPNMPRAGKHGKYDRRVRYK